MNDRHPGPDDPAPGENCRVPAGDDSEPAEDHPEPPAPDVYEPL